MQPEPKRSVVDMHAANEGQPRTQRPSLLIDLLTGDLGSRGHMNRTPAETPISHSTAPQSAPHSIHQSNSSSTVKSTQPSQASAPPNGVHTARGMILITSFFINMFAIMYRVNSKFRLKESKIVTSNRPTAGLFVILLL